MAGANPERLRTLLSPVVSAAGLDLEELSLSSAGRRRLVRLAVDCDGGVSLDAIAEVSRQVSAVLDSAGTMGEQPYVLEVSSPGVGRPLTEPRHWRRARGRLVTVTFSDGSTFTGRVQDATDAEIALDGPGGPRTIGLDEVGRARVEVEFSHDEPTELPTADAAADQDGRTTRNGSGRPDQHREEA